MKNKTVGILIVAIALIMAFMIYSFNRALTEIVNTSCSHGPECPMWGSIKFHTNLSLALTTLVALIGLYLVSSSEKEEPEEPKKKNFDKIMKKLGKNEKTLFSILVEEDGALFQSDLVDKSGFSKVKVSRTLDKLEGKGLLERKRRGMSNMVVLKH